MFRPGSHPLDRLYFAMMAGIGILSSAIILAALYLLTTAFDRNSADIGNKKLSFLLQEWTNTLVASAEDVAAGIEPVSGQTGAPKIPEPASGGVFDWVAVVDADGRLISERNLPDDWNAPAFFGGDAFEQILDQIAQNETTDRISVGGPFEIDGNRFLAATTGIALDETLQLESSVAAYFVGGRDLDSDALNRMAASIGGRSAFFSAEQSERSIALHGPLGFIGNLSWQGEMPGAQFRKTALPGVLLMCSGFVFLTSWMAAHFRKMVHNLERMQKIATTDHLTGVANRAALTEMLQTSLMQGALESGQFAVISLDLDDFKQLNDEHGHHAGDAALRIAAERITQSVGKHEEVFRMGGDEFLCLVFDPDPKGAAEQVVHRLEEAFQPPMNLGGVSRIVSPSIGVALAAQGENWDNILERSDAAMYRAKRREGAQRLCVS